jgi:hypothetical protein
VYIYIYIYIYNRAPVEGRKALEIVEYKIPGAGRCADAKTNVKRGEEREEEKEGRLLRQL